MRGGLRNEERSIITPDFQAQTRPDHVLPGLFQRSEWEQASGRNARGCSHRAPNVVAVGGVKNHVRKSLSPTDE